MLYFISTTGIVKQHCGKFSVNSEGVNLGATFTVELPLYVCDVFAPWENRVLAHAHAEGILADKLFLTEMSKSFKNRSSKKFDNVLQMGSLPTNANSTSNEGETGFVPLQNDASSQPDDRLFSVGATGTLTSTTRQQLPSTQPASEGGTTVGNSVVEDGSMESSGAVGKLTTPTALGTKDSLRPAQPLVITPRSLSVTAQLQSPRSRAVSGDATPRSRAFSADEDLSITSEHRWPALKKVMVVDDVLSNRKMLMRLLQRKGIECNVEAEDGHIAVNMYKQAKGSSSEEPFDAILMDYEMPVMNGPTATKVLRDMGCVALIVGVSGNVLPADVEYYLSMGANAVLPKPLNYAELEKIWANKFNV